MSARGWSTGIKPSQVSQQASGLPHELTNVSPFSLSLFLSLSLSLADIETTKRKLLSCEAELQSKQNKDLTNLRREVAAEKVMTRKLTFKVFLRPGRVPQI